MYDSCQNCIDFLDSFSVHLDDFPYMIDTLPAVGNTSRGENNIGEAHHLQNEAFLLYLYLWAPMTTKRKERPHNAGKFKKMERTTFF